MHSKPRLAFLAVPALLALAGCTASREAPPEAPMPTTTEDTLASHHWRLDEAVDREGTRMAALFPGGNHRLELAFADGRLSISGGCNNASGQYRLGADGTLEVGEFAATLMACQEPLMQADRTLHELLASGPLQLRLQQAASPLLVLESTAGARTSWTGEPTAEARYGGPGERVFLEVAPRKVACNHPLIADHQCLQVREVRYDEAGLRQPPAEDWRPLHEQIEGFEFVEGERKVLRVKRFTLDPVPADRSAVAWVLDMVVETERVAPSR